MDFDEELDEDDFVLIGADGEEEGVNKCFQVRIDLISTDMLMLGQFMTYGQGSDVIWARFSEAFTAILGMSLSGTPWDCNTPIPGPPALPDPYSSTIKTIQPSVSGPFCRELRTLPPSKPFPQWCLFLGAP